jgi:hypothetical protein
MQVFTSSDQRMIDGECRISDDARLLDQSNEAARDDLRLLLQLCERKSSRRFVVDAAPEEDHVDSFLCHQDS